MTTLLLISGSLPKIDIIMQSIVSNKIVPIVYDPFGSIADLFLKIATETGSLSKKSLPVFYRVGIMSHFNDFHILNTGNPITFLIALATYLAVSFETSNIDLIMCDASSSPEFPRLSTYLKTTIDITLAGSNGLIGPDGSWTENAPFFENLIGLYFTKNIKTYPVDLSEVGVGAVHSGPNGGK